MVSPKPHVWTLNKTIASDLSAGSQAVEPLLDQMRELGWPEFEVLRVQLAYEEAVTNAIRHGNKLAPEKTVDLEFTCDDDWVRVRIADQGPGFNPADVPDPREEDLLENPGGRGVLLIRELMSRVAYNGRGNELTMEKDREPACPPGFNGDDS